MKVLKRSIDPGEALVVLVLFFASGAFGPLLFNGATPDQLAAGSPLLQAIQLVIYLFTAYRALQIRSRISRMLRANKPMVALVVMSVISCCWSADPAVTFRRSIGAALTTLFAVDMAARYSLRKLVSLAGTAIFAGIVLSIIFQLFFPNAVPRGIYADTGLVDDAWRGIYDAKNGFGVVLALATIVLLAYVKRSRRGYVLLVSGLAAVIALEIMAQSRTALVTSLLMVLLWPVLSMLRWKARKMSTLGVALVLIFIPAALLLWQRASALASLMDRNSDLTGRTTIWSLCFEAIAKRPLLGYGYSAFWNATDESAHIRYILGWDTPYAHNTYIDVLLQLGTIGLLLYIVYIVLALKRAVQHGRNTETPEGLWPLAYLLFTQIYSITESASFLASSSIFWILLVSAACSVSETARKPASATRALSDRHKYVGELEESCV